MDSSILLVQECDQSYWQFGLASAFFGLSSGSLMPYRIISRMIAWLYFLVSSLAFFMMVLHISAYSIRCFCRRFSPYLIVSSSVLVLVMISSISVACCFLSCSLLDHACDCFANGIDVV